MKDIVRAAHDPKLLRLAFKDLTSWKAWFVYLRALFGLPINDAEDLQLFRESTQLGSPPSLPARESYAIVGRRGGKSFISAIIATYLAGSRDWVRVLGTGERGWVFVLAVDRAQAKIIKTYCEDILHVSPTLSQLVREVTRDEIRLRNGATIAVKTSSFRSVRGYSVLCCICEELGFWRNEESAEPDVELLRAVRPALETVPGSVLLAISTPYSKSGALWVAYKDHYGKAGGPLVWKASSLRMNPTLSSASIEARLAEDPVAGASEWLSEFRSDITSFIPMELIESLIVLGRKELSKVGGVSYHAFTDPSGGSEDSFALCVAHRDQGGRIVVDCLRERRPPFSAENVVAEFSEVVRSYGLTRVRGDKYAGEWPREAFRRHGIDYQVAEKSASELFSEVLPILTSGSVELLDSSRLKGQLANLERRVRSGGRDAIGHGPGGHDDIAVCMAGAILMAGRNGMRKGRVYIHGKLVSGPPPERAAGPTRQQVFGCRSSSCTRDPDELVRQSLKRWRRPPDQD